MLGDEDKWKRSKFQWRNGRTDDYRETLLSHLNRMGNSRPSKYVLLKKAKDYMETGYKTNVLTGSLNRRDVN